MVKNQFFDGMVESLEKGDRIEIKGQNLVEAYSAMSSWKC
jgi:hypothetical protein